MAILTHELNGPAAIEVIEGGTYRDAGSTATGDNGEIVYSNDKASIDFNTPADYTVTYSAIDDTAIADTSVTRSVKVVAKVAPIDTTFDLGDEDKKGEDTSGTKYDALVDAAREGTPPAEASSAYFSDTALDPYEVQYSK